MVGLRTHVAFLGAFCVVISELIKILPVCDKECQEHLIFNKYTQAARNMPKKVSLQHRTPNTNYRLSQQHPISVLQAPLNKSIIGTRSSTITTVSSILSRSQGGEGAKHSSIQRSIPHVVKGSAVLRSVQQYTVSKSSMQQFRSPSGSPILSPLSSSTPQLVQKTPISATSTSLEQANMQVQSMTPKSMHKTFGVKATGNFQNKSAGILSKVPNTVPAKPASDTCKKSNTSSEKRLHSISAPNAVQKNTTAQLGELVNLFSRALTQILGKENRSIKYAKQVKDSASSIPKNAAAGGISAGVCLEMPGHKIGALEQGIRALQWRLQRLEMANSNAHSIQYIVPQYYPYVYPPYYGGTSYSNPSPAQQTSQVQGTSLVKAVEKEMKESSGEKQNTAPHTENHGENDIDTTTKSTPCNEKQKAAPHTENHGENNTDTVTGSTHNSEVGTEIDEDDENVVSDTNTRSKKIEHGGDSRKMSYEIRGKDVWDRVLSNTRKALLSKLKGEVADMRNSSGMIGGFSFVGSKNTEERTPVSLGVKMHRKRSWPIDYRKLAQAAAMFQEGRHAYVHSEEENSHMLREEKMQTGDAYNMLQEHNTLLEQVKDEDEAQNALISERVAGIIGGTDHIDISRNTMRTRPLYQNLEEFGYKEPTKGNSILELVRRKQDLSSEDVNAAQRRSYGSISDDNGSHSESAEYMYLSDLIRLCSRR